MDQQLLEKSQTDGKEIQPILDRPNFQLLNLLPKRKLIQTILQDLFHKKLINNMMEFHNSRSHLTLETQKILMTSKIGITQIRKDFQEFCHMPKLIQMKPSELMVTTMKMPTMLIFQVIQNS
jgi:hypothetical protein